MDAGGAVPGRRRMGERTVIHSLVNSTTISLPQQMELMLRIVVAAVCGWAIGMERSRRFKDAGVRTHCLVAAAAAMLMIVSKYGFTDMAEPGVETISGTRGADPARIAAQIVSGVSFLGVGIIYRDRKLATRGLTTAAGIWAVAGIGMAVGSGLYLIGLFTTVFVLLLQFLTHRYALGKDKYVGLNLELDMVDDPDALSELQHSMEANHIVITESRIYRENDGLRCTMLVRMESRRYIQELIDHAMASPLVRSVTINEED